MLRTRWRIRWIALPGVALASACGSQDSTLVWQDDASATSSGPPERTNELPSGLAGPPAILPPTDLTAQNPPSPALPPNGQASTAPSEGNSFPPPALPDDGAPSGVIDPASAVASGLDRRPDSAPLALPGTLELAAPGWIAEESFPALTFDDPISMAEVPGGGQIVVTEREGRVYAFVNDASTTEKRLLLDLSDRTQGEHDCGLLGMAFHPEFGTAGSANGTYIYLHYAFNPDVAPGKPAQNTTTRSRLSRFTLDRETLLIDPASELILIDQLDENVIHQGGAMFFHPVDRFLYLAVGDEGRGLCGLGNCQRLDRDLFSGVLRIDVDMRGGDVSHPIPRQPATGITANYFIPNDNPFVGQAGVLEEFYALGLRSPHRMTFDSIDGITWIGELGEKTREELNVLRPGANYQWSVLEGTLAGPLAPPAQPLGVWTPPVLELERTESTALIGGYVYRGTKNPSLYGKYIFGDYELGTIWALSYSYDGTNTTVLNREALVRTPFRGADGGITSFGIDRNGELYILTLGSQSKIYHLGRTGGFSNVPRHLSETRVFEDTSSSELHVTSGLIPYDVQSPLWSDGARKLRWASVPNGTTVEFSETGAWTFPSGSVFVKHFELIPDEAKPALKRRLETRLLVHGDGGDYYGLTYKWNDAGTDAELLLEPQREPINVALIDGDTRELSYFYPGPADCGVCHNANAGFVLGVRTSQLNHDMAYAETGRTANQVYTWGQVGLLDIAPDEATVGELVSLAAIDDEMSPLEDRVRSYWASNCSMCHGSLPDIRASWNARYEVPLAEQGVVLGPSESAGDENAFLITPGDPEASVLFLRSRSELPGFAMPPLGRSVEDAAYVAALERWIRSLPASVPLQ